ncbi:hypothetical protein FOL47_000160 [Perkinsus chesapeaki]|uniref:N-acetyltransferase domain-containing protein n=1 Tax=Perkinsus chesapeaki TaxID=330153 RepID=A0A7J6MMY1_PERCH|nr:hypothetical protein FOL47_000160 [Perkinsus chesapeaki]
MNLYLYLLPFVLVAGNIAYRDYQEGDYSDSSSFSKCSKERSTPCYVAIDSQGKPHEVVGFIVMTIPDTKSMIEEAAVRSEMSDPKKSGTFGYIDEVEVSPKFRGGGIGTQLIRYSIQQGRKAKNVLAMTLYVDEENDGAIPLSKRMGFIEVLGESCLVPPPRLLSSKAKEL